MQQRKKSKIQNSKCPLKGSFRGLSHGELQASVLGYHTVLSPQPRWQNRKQEQDLLLGYWLVTLVTQERCSLERQLHTQHGAAILIFEIYANLNTGERGRARGKASSVHQTQRAAATDPWLSLTVCITWRCLPPPPPVGLFVIAVRHCKKLSSA